MKPIALAVLLAALGLAACDPHAADATAGAGEPADAPADAPAADFSGDFTLTGTEPFWSMVITADRLLFSRIDEGDFTAPNNGPVVEGDTAAWDGGPLKVTLRPEPCSDGVSDRAYAFSAHVVLEGTAERRGCANRAEP